PPANGGSGSAGTAAPSGKASDVRGLGRNGSGGPNAGGNTPQALAGKGFVPGGAENHPRGTINTTEIRYATSDLAKAQLLATYVPGAQLVSDSSLSGDIVLALGTNFRGVGSGAT